MRANKYAVLGSPISHSLSPVLHRAAYRVLGRDWEYSQKEVAEADLGHFLATVPEVWAGFSLTMPLKTAVIPLLNQSDELGKITGSINTIWRDSAESRDSHRWRGANTDVQGIVHSLTSAQLADANEVVILGAGATARSALVAVSQLGATEVTVYARNTQRGDLLLQLAQKLAVPVRINPLQLFFVDSLTASVIISTLPGNSIPATQTKTIRFRSDSLLCDVAYHPWPTALAEHWKSRGGRVLSGVNILVYQALLQIRIFSTGDITTPLPDEEAVLTQMFAALPAVSF